MNSKNAVEITLLKDNEWSKIDGVPCRVIDFVPMAKIENGKITTINTWTPYASIHMECKGVKEKIIGFITQKNDFEALWAAFKERAISDNEDVIVVWTTKRYKNKLLNLYTAIWPKLLVLVCSKGAFKLVTDLKGLIGETRTKATSPIVWWKPEVMDFSDYGIS